MCHNPPGVACIYINYDADRQRQEFRASGGTLKVWGASPKIIKAQYVTGAGETKTSLLLASGALEMVINSWVYACRCLVVGVYCRCFVVGVLLSVFYCRCLLSVFYCRCLVVGVLMSVFYCRCLVVGVWLSVFGCRCLVLDNRVGLVVGVW